MAAAAPAGVANPGSVPADAAAPAEDLAIALDGDCTIEATRLALGDSGIDVQCLQQGLVTAGFLDGAVTGQFDQATYAAVEDAADRAAAVRRRHRRPGDGHLRRRLARRGGARRPHAAAGARRRGLDGLPALVGVVRRRRRPAGARRLRVGRRIVYERAGQRVWAIDSDDQVIRSWLVSGSKYGNEQPGFHEVYSRSEQSTAWNGKAILPLMVRYQKTDIGAIGFHGIPMHVEDGSAYQTEAELGTRLSGGCQRQANPDAAFMWNFAQVGTTVVVI